MVGCTTSLWVKGTGDQSYIAVMTDSRLDALNQFHVTSRPSKEQRTPGADGVYLSYILFQSPQHAIVVVDADICPRNSFFFSAMFGSTSCSGISQKNFIKVKCSLEHRPACLYLGQIS